VFYRSTLLLMVVVQFYHLWFAVLVVPSDFDTDAHRSDCLLSAKGGKVAESDTTVLPRSSTNPCFCHVGAWCTLSEGTAKVLDDQGNKVSRFLVTKEEGKNTTSSEECVDDELSICQSAKNVTIERAIPATRDCSRARSATCSLHDPCTPCGLDRAFEFGDRWSRCRNCENNDMKDCNFVEGVGPYCFADAFKRSVVPCEQCCTEKERRFVGDGEGGQVCF